MTRYRVLKQKFLLRDALISLSHDQVRLADGRQFSRYTIHHPGAVAVVPFLTDDRVVLIRQFRYATGKDIWEIPAGTLERGEGILQCICRELAEEIGYRPRRVTWLTHFYPAPGVSNEVMYLCKASHLVKASRSPDDDEVITKKVVTLRQAYQMVLRGDIIDAKTIIGLLWCYWGLRSVGQVARYASRRP